MGTVREARPADVAGIRRVAREAWHAAYGDLMTEAAIEATLRDYYDAEAVERAVGAETVVYLVAVADGRVVGYASGGANEESGPETAELSSIYVDPDRWGEGVGSRLFGALSDRLRERGFGRVRAVVLAANGAGRPFYRARGFERVDEHEERVGGETHRALVLERALPEGDGSGSA